jgi:cytochrome c-type biogenesis protein
MIYYPKKRGDVVDYFISFLEGIITFISPCILPMLPIYISYFMGDNKEKKKELIINALMNSIGFVIGFQLFYIIRSSSRKLWCIYTKNILKLLML